MNEENVKESEHQKNLRKSIGISLEKKKRNPKNVLVESSYQVKMRGERT